MNRGLWRALAITLIVFALLAAVGLWAYNTGLAQGFAASAQFTPPESGGVPAAGYYGAPWGFYRPWGWGPFFGPLGCLFPLLFVFLVFALVRGLFWRRHWHGGWHGGYGREGDPGHGVPPHFADWHRRAHAGDVPPEPQPPER
jgi:hypothetical protein